MAAIDALGGIPGDAASVTFLCSLVADRDGDYRKAAGYFEEAVRLTHKQKNPESVTMAIMCR